MPTDSYDCLWSWSYDTVLDYQYQISKWMALLTSSQPWGWSRSWERLLESNRRSVYDNKCFTPSLYVLSFWFLFFSVYPFIIFYFPFCCPRFLTCVEKAAHSTCLLSFVFHSSSLFLSIRKTSSLHPLTCSLSCFFLQLLRGQRIWYQALAGRSLLSLLCTLTPNGRHTYLKLFNALGCLKTCWTIAVQVVRAVECISLWFSLN